MDPAMLLGAARPIIVEVPEAGGGASLESILVFIAGAMAAVAAIIAALVTTRGASRRLEETLESERDRFETQLAAERERVGDQISHERYLARREEASAAVEEITRLVARNSAHFDELKRTVLRGGKVAREQSDLMDEQVDQMREETSVVAVRFGGQSPLVDSMVEVLTALIKGDKALQKAETDDGPEAKEELRQASDELAGAAGAFVNVARKALETYD